MAALEVPVEHLIINKANFGKILYTFLQVNNVNIKNVFSERLYGPLFSKIQVRKLTIKDTPLAILEDYVFFGINKTLEELELLNTNLAQFTPHSFGVSRNNFV